MNAHGSPSDLMLGRRELWNIDAISVVEDASQHVLQFGHVGKECHNDLYRPHAHAYFPMDWHEPA